jgi:predicted transcriptional regulator
MTLTDTDRRKMAAYMRIILRDQVRHSNMDPDLTREIKSSGLLQEHAWPGHHVTLTERGREFLNEVEGDE